MKKIFILGIGIMLSTNVHAVVGGAGMSRDECRNALNGQSFSKCCCPFGTWVEPTINCPSGWTYNSNNGKCERATQRLQTGTNGLYNIEYGSCNADVIDNNKYMLASANDGTGRCYCLSV